MAASSLPLLQLPSEVITEVLKSMDTIDKIAISLVSKATKLLVTRVNLGDRDWNIYVENTFNFHIYLWPCAFTWHFKHDDPETNQPVKLLKEDAMREGIPTTYEWTKKGFGVKNWIHHLLKITNTSNISWISFHKAGERFSMDFVKDIIKGLNIRKLSIQPECSNAYNQSILNSVKTSILEMNHNPYQDKELFQKNLMENFETISFLTGPVFTLNDLLAMNSSTIDIQTPGNITKKTLNRFIKCWKTGSNRQLKFMIIVIRNYIAPNIDEILKGIKYKKHPEDQTRDFEVREGLMMTIRGGYDICAFDGRKATLSFQMYSLVFMLVWPF